MIPSQTLKPSRKISSLLERFVPITLNELNERAELLERRDSKYVLTTQQLYAFLAHAKNDFDMLEINKRRQFQYRTVYFDSDDYQCYQDHNKGRRKRVKIRHRHYVDHDLYFFEVKVKGRRNTTHKYRMPITASVFAARSLSDSLHHFCDNAIAAHHGRGWGHNVKRGLTVHYNRMTLVAKDGEERITIDSRLSFSEGDQSIRLRESKWVVEVKSSTGISNVDQWLYRNRSRPVPKCSKYCIGISLLKLPRKSNRFTPVIRHHFNHLA